jgi:nitrile hydratase subunit beta
MNGAHDMGGMHGFGPVEPEPNEPPFHSEWERRAFALTVAMGATGEWNIDQSRFARESIPPAEYLAKTYYEIWFAGLERLLQARRLVNADEIAAARALHPPKPVKRTLAAGDVAATLGRGGPTVREPTVPARFKLGDRVRARQMNPTTHTRLPRYVRGHVGTVERIYGCHVFPDSHAQGLGENPQWLYAVCFDARDLWGPEADPSAKVSVDAFEPYLEPA